jgi:hypothetical protein
MQVKGLECATFNAYQSRTQRPRSSPFNLQGVNQPKSIGSSSLGEANLDCKYLEHVSLINLAFFILKKKFLRSIFHCAYFD